MARQLARGLVRRVSSGYRAVYGLTRPQVASRFRAAAGSELGLVRAFFAQAGRELPADLERLERQWDAHTREAFDPKAASSFYQSWVGEIGYLNVVANVRDQFRRIELFHAYESRLPPHACRLIDVGCGTAALTLQFAARFDEVWLVDVENVAKDYVRFKVDHSPVLKNVRTFLPDDLSRQPDGCADVVACIDVLEHLPNPSEVFCAQLDRLLKRGGLLFLQAPWGGGVPEHLPEAPRDWGSGGGSELLREGYRKERAISHLIERKSGCVSAVYRKR